MVLGKQAFYLQSLFVILYYVTIQVLSYCSAEGKTTWTGCCRPIKYIFMNKIFGAIYIFAFIK